MPTQYSFNQMPGSLSASGSSGMYLDGTTLKGGLCNHHIATTVGEGADGSALTNGSYMFRNSTSLTSWSTGLPNLTNGSYMFNECSKLASFLADLPNLTNGDHMFYKCSVLASWTKDLPKLTNGDNMFYYTGLTSWSTGLPNLTNGSYMFGYCTKLTSFNSTLPALDNGKSMFYNCKLDEASVLRILNSIPTYTSGTYQLHLGKRTNFLNSADIATLLGTTVPIAAKSTYSYKGWTITITT